ncbi:mediator of RNA polymerase II transcription subunit 22 isoform X1 [Centruroides vittatus]|nr:mediator of RNA polymerase II transcription subunit 22-like isoform X2 [Centruroides sculpturatus]
MAHFYIKFFLIMSQQKALPQSKEALLKSYNKRLKDDIKSLVDNFVEIVKSARIGQDEDSQLFRMTQTAQDQYEMHVRAANIVRAGESLMKLISDIKQYLILNDFPSVNEVINQKSKFYQAVQTECDKKLIALRDDVAAELYELEEEYYSSVYKSMMPRLGSI